MTKKCLYFMLIVLVITLASPAFADSSSEQNQDDLWLRILATASNGETDDYASITTIKCSPQYADGYDGEIPITTENTPSTYAAIFHENNENVWTGPTGFYSRDCASSLLPGKPKSWLLYVWSTSDIPNGYNNTYIIINRMDNIALTGDLELQVALKSKPSSITDGLEVGTTWNLDLDNNLIINIPTYRTDNGLTGYLFELTATAVPEPSAILTILCGMTGLSMSLRRKR